MHIPSPAGLRSPLQNSLGSRHFQSLVSAEVKCSMVCVGVLHADPAIDKLLLGLGESARFSVTQDVTTTREAAGLP